MKKVFLTVLVIVAACQPEPERPADLIGKQDMAQLLTEIHLLEAKMNQLQVRPSDSKQYVFNHYEALLFEDFGVSHEQYETSLTYYLDNPGEFEKVYTAVLDTLVKREELSRVDYER